MSIKVIIPMVCLLARVAVGEETVASFAKQSLGFDLAAVPFGGVAQTNFAAGDAPVLPPPLIGTNVAWMTNAVSGKYRQDHPNRTLRYGFREGRLEIVRISISSFDGVGAVNGFVTGNEIFEERRKELRQIMDEIVKFKASLQAKHKDAGFRIRYGAMCAPTPESLFLLEIEIMPVAGARSGGAEENDSGTK